MTIPEALLLPSTGSKVLVEAPEEFDTAKVISRNMIEIGFNILKAQNTRFTIKRLRHYG